MRVLIRELSRHSRSLIFGALAVLALVAVFQLDWQKPVSAELVGPRASDRQVTAIVTALVSEEHLTKFPLDDKISQRGFQSFLDTLDPMKLYFYKSDVAQFSEYQTVLDDQLKKRETSFSYTVFKRFLVRVDERVRMVNELLETPLNFERDEVLVTDADKLDYPRNAAEAKDRWRKRLKYDLLSLKLDDVEGEEAKKKLRSRYKSFAKRMHQTDGDELLEMYLTAITSSYDPHTTYMSPSTLENFRINMRLGLEGIGAALQIEDSYTVVSKVIPGGAAAKHGKLAPKDKIVSVGQGEAGEMVEVVDRKLGDVVKLIRGPAGTIVRLGVVPAAGGETQIYKITRAKIALKDSEARAEIIEEGKKLDGSPMRIGVIDLPSFYMDMEAARKGLNDYKSTTRDVRKILENFNSKKVDAVILDLRNNGGGSLTEAIDLTGLFIDQGPVVQVKDSAGRVSKYDDTKAGQTWDGPLVVVTNKFSASASEILAGAIQDYHRGLVVGDSATHGKGTVQSLLDLGAQVFRRLSDPPNLGALKITMQQFYRPNGDSTQQRGVESDIVLPSLSDQMDVSESDLDYAVAFHKIDPAKYTLYNMVSKSIVQSLKLRSEGRRAKSEDFAKLRKNIQRYLTQKERKQIFLNEKKYMAEREELNAEKEEEKQFQEDEDDKDKVVDRNFYFNEVLAITQDYVQTLESQKRARNR